MKATILKNRAAIGAGAVALALVCSITAAPAMSYFTANVKAEGGHVLTLGSQTETHEEVTPGEKQVTIENTGDGPCFVRVRGYSGASYPLTYSGSGWTDGGDGWWYMDGPLAAGATSPTLVISIEVPKGTTDDFHVVVVHEATQISTPDGLHGVWPATKSGKEA